VQPIHITGARLASTSPYDIVSNVSSPPLCWVSLLQRPKIAVGVSIAVIRDVMKTGTASLFFSAVVACTLSIAAPSAGAANAPCAVVEMAPPSALLGTSAATLRSTAEAEIRKVDATLQRGRRRLVISFVVTPADEGARRLVGVNATVRDARTGAMIAVIETNARTDGPVSPEQRKELAFAAIRSAVRRVPSAIHCG
jgi:hypothetical protein